MIARVILLAVFAWAIALPAAADDPAGAWEFRTEIREKGCAISGLMTIEPRLPGSETRACRFVSSETCGPEDLQPVEMEQTCRIIMQGNFLLIRSQVEASLTEGVPVTRYLPDHFTVRPTGPGRMAGTWHDRNFSDHVEFWRAEGGATS